MVVNIAAAAAGIRTNDKELSAFFLSVDLHHHVGSSSSSEVSFLFIFAKKRIINGSSGCNSTTAQQQTNKAPFVVQTVRCDSLLLRRTSVFFPRWRSTTRRLRAPNKKGEKERKRGRRWWLDFLFFFISFSSPRLALALRRALGLWSLGCLEKFHLQRKRERECVRERERAWESVRKRGRVENVRIPGKRESTKMIS